MPAYQAAQLHSLFQDAFNRADGAAIAALYEEDAVLVVDGAEVRGRDAIRASYEESFERNARMTLVTRAVFEGPDGLAVLHGAWVVSPVGEGLTTRGLSTEVVRRQADGHWLFVIDNPFTPTGRAGILEA